MTEHEELLQEVRACQRCEAELPMGPRPVIQHHPDAKILIVGQAPGRRVHESGKPFDDPSGVRLRQWMNISAEKFYDPIQLAILPMGFCYPGTGRSGDLPPRKECLPWREPLMGMLPNIKLTILLGQYAQRYHFPDHKGSLTDLVKQADVKNDLMIPLPHPSPRNNRWLKQQPWFERDFIPLFQQRLSNISL
ncbi:uracil-DNA glycosylase family protein [uncultured Pseudoteredinibacter sp.]|uniref:uracil-DNA glycosylase family protein n=1 Tax=uncultured Pseudoteredinibacter sp. TaxID=1641701 RepID=UPI0026082B63|nr:uracil-DNA glycosylase family protein [uncultured Pseudoteredinibacter sp.]